MWIKRVDKERCEYIQLVFKGNEIVAVFDEITNADYNIDAFLQLTESIDEDEYNSLYERYFNI